MHCYDRFMLGFTFGFVILISLSQDISAQTNAENIVISGEGSPIIKWKVSRRFRFLIKGAEPVFAQHEMAFDQFKSFTSEGVEPDPLGRGRKQINGEWVGPILFVERHLASKTGSNRSSGWAEKLWYPPYDSKRRGPFRKTMFTCWDIGERRLAKKCTNSSSENAFFPQKASISVNVGTPGQWKGHSCEWSIGEKKDGTFLKHSNGKLFSCVDPVWFRPAIGKDFFLKVIIRKSGDLNSEPLTIMSDPQQIASKLIVGLGDSYASGEGNPDVAAGYASQQDRISNKRRPQASYPRRWNDWPCHRSIYSHQYRIGLQLAIENKHRIISMLSYACSGATIRQVVDKYGSKDFPDAPKKSKIRKEYRYQSRSLSKRILKRFMKQKSWSQIQQAVADLCDVPGLRESIKPPKNCIKFKRPIDLVLINIGGNDVGFGKVVMHVSAKANSSKLKELLGIISPETMIDIAEGKNKIPKCKKNKLGQECTMELRYKTAAKMINEQLKLTNNAQVLIGSPPSPFGNPDVPPCESGQTISANNLNKMTDIEKAHVRVTCEKLNNAQSVLFKENRFQKALAKAFKSTGWTFEGLISESDIFHKHAIFTANQNEVRFLSMPNYQRIKRRWRWVPYKPNKFAAYKSRNRWYRGLNDSVLVQYQHTILRHLIGSPNAIDRYYLSGISSFYHPTAEGQAAIADMLMAKARCILESGNPIDCQ